MRVLLKGKKYKWLLLRKGSPILKENLQINNKTIIEFGPRRYEKLFKGLSLCYLPQSPALADNANLCLNNSSYPARPHSIIVYY